MEGDSNGKREAARPKQSMDERGAGEAEREVRTQRGYRQYQAKEEGVGTDLREAQIRDIKASPLYRKRRKIFKTGQKPYRAKANKPSNLSEGLRG